MEPETLLLPPSPLVHSLKVSVKWTVGVTDHVSSHMTLCYHDEIWVLLYVCACMCGVLTVCIPGVWVLSVSKHILLYFV